MDPSRKGLVRIALDANIKLQTALAEKAQKLEVQLAEIDRLLGVQEVEDEPESEVVIPGSKRAVGLFPSSEFLNPLSPFYVDASRRNTYLMNTHPRPMKEKDLEVLASAVKKENERLQALRRSHMSASASEIETNTPIDATNNIDGLDWDRIAERVSDSSSVKRNASECRVVWIANRPCVNRAPWTSSELQQLHSLTSRYPHNKVNWVEVAEKLGTNRIPIDCMRQEIYPQRHYWTPDADQRLIKAIETYGIDNWYLVARKVDENVTPIQCQARWCKSLDPSLIRGAWTEEEDNQLRKAVAGYGTSWVQVASAVPGRTNDQCRERWTEHLNVGPEQSWTDEEDKILQAAVAELGTRWKEISLKVGNKKSGPACRRRYDKLKRAQKRQATSPPTPSTSGSFTAAETSTMSFSLESVPMIFPATASDAGYVNDLPPAAPVPKPRPRPRPRQKAAAGDGESTVVIEVPKLTSTTPVSTSAPSEGEAQVVCQLSRPAETNPTNADIERDQILPGSSVDSSSAARTDASTKGKKRKTVGKAEADSSSKKTRRTRPQTKGTTTEDSSVQKGGNATADSVAADDNKANTEVVKPRRGRSAAKVG